MDAKEKAVALELESLLWDFVTEEINAAVLAFRLGTVLPDFQKMLGVTR